MNTGDRNIRGRVIYRGPRGGLYVINQAGKKLYKFTIERNNARRAREENARRAREENNARLAAELQREENARLQPRALQFNNANENTIYKRSFGNNNVTILNNNNVPMDKVNKYVYDVAEILVSFNGSVPAKVMLALDSQHTDLAPYVLNSANELQAIITNRIAMCHLVESLHGQNINQANYLKQTYLKRMRNQMVQACKTIMEKIKKRKMTKEAFANSFNQLYADRPCIENLIQALSDVAYGEIGWKGKNSNKLLQLEFNRKVTPNARRVLRNNIIGTYIKPLFNSMTKPQQIRFNKQVLWNSIKNKDVYRINPWYNNAPLYAPLSNIRNARNVSNEAFNEYAQWLNVPNKYNVLINAIKRYKQAHRR
jgi:hypothetical protein